MSRPRLALFTVLLSLPACDKVQELLGDEKQADAKADDAKTTDAKAADAKVADAKAPDAKAPDAKAPDAAPADAKAPDAAPAEPPVADAAPAEAQPCIIGSWDATDYTAAVRRAIAKDPTLRSFKKSSSGGHVTYVLDPPKDGKGVIKATADALTYTFSGKVEGFAVTLKVKIDGDTVADYELIGTDSIKIAKPTSNTMKVDAKATVKGLGAARDSDKVDLDFDGTFVFECSQTDLKVWREKRTEGESTDFKRKPL